MLLFTLMNTLKRYRTVFGKKFFYCGVIRQYFNIALYSGKLVFQINVRHGIVIMFLLLSSHFYS